VHGHGTVLTMCLLVAISRDRDESPLIVAANRDELLDRPAVAMTVLQAHGPRILGGRDELAGGTWLAVNEAGVVAGLTNQPATNGRDPTKRSRGELPLALARSLDAPTAVERFVTSVKPADYNAAWLLVSDRSSLFYIDLNDGDAPAVNELPPGTHVLENRPLGGASPKVDNMRRLLEPLGAVAEAELVPALRAVLANHDIPAGADAERAAGTTERPPEVAAACVHTQRYGTRSAAVVVIPPDPDARPRLWYTDGPGCLSPLQDASGLWPEPQPSAAFPHQLRREAPGGGRC